MDINSITEIKADGIRYMVRTETSPTLGLATDGQINYDQQQITIKNTKPAVWLQILWHELLSITYPAIVLATRSQRTL